MAAAVVVGRRAPLRPPPWLPSPTRLVRRRRLLAPAQAAVSPACASPRRGWRCACRPAATPSAAPRLRRLLSEAARHRRPAASGQADAGPPPRPPHTPVTRRPQQQQQQQQHALGNTAARSSWTGRAPHENIYNLPNLLTLTRLFAAPATAYLFLHHHHAWALGVFAYAGITDWVDGWMARTWKLQTVAGSVMDPMADKALMIVLTVTLAVKGAIPLYLATVILGRDASLAVAAIYYRYASLPAPKTMRRYWDFSLPSAEVHPTTVSKYNTFLQLVLIGSSLALPLTTAGHADTGIVQRLLGLSTSQLHTGMDRFQWLVAATTAWTGLGYAYARNVVTITGTDEVLKAKQGARGRAIIGLTFGSCVLAAAWLAFNVDRTPAEPETVVDDERKEM